MLQEAADRAAQIGDFKVAYRHLYVMDAVRDSADRANHAREMKELAAKYDMEGKDREIALLEKGKRLSELELQQRKAELERHRLMVLQREQAIGLLENEREIQRLDLAQQKSEMELNASALALSRAEQQKTQREIKLQAASLDRESLLRNILLSGLLLFMVVTGLVFKNLRDRRRAANVQAETAEYKVRAANAEAHTVRAENERKAKEAQQAFSKQLITLHEMERKRVAGALHDGIGQDLLIIKHRAMMALEERPAETGHLRGILDVSSEAINEVRKMSRDLRPYQLERVGLTVTLRSMLQSVSESTSLEINMDIHDVDGLIEPDREIDLYRVVQEGVNNIMKHAEASTAWISLHRVNGTLLLTIRDNGKGFDLAALQGSMETSGIGLQGMTERIRMLAGSLNIDSAHGSGTIIQASIPVLEKLAEESEAGSF
jgi:signal transduction histidine kinase